MSNARSARSRDILARRPEQLTRAWAQGVLDRAAPGTRVADVEVRSIDVGTATRVRLTVDHDGDASVPRRWFVKLPSSTWRARVLVGLVRLPQQEVRFYQRLAPALSPSCPQALVAAARPTRGFTVVLPDLAESGATTSNAADQLTADQVAGVIDTLADIHARGQALGAGERRWPDGRSRRLEDCAGAVLSIPLVRRGLARAGELVPVDIHRSLRHYAFHRAAVTRELGETGPATVVHHDCHPGNLYWHHERAGLLDWQLVRRGDGIGDVAYLLASSLTPQDRSAHERALIADYVKALSARGAETGTDPFGRYRKHLTYALEAMLVTLAVGGFMPDEDARELVRRTAAAAAANDAFRAVDALRR